MAQSQLCPSVSVTILGRDESGEQARKRRRKQKGARGSTGRGRQEAGGEEGKGGVWEGWNGVQVAVPAIGSNSFPRGFVHSFTHPFAPPFVQEVLFAYLLRAGSVHRLRGASPTNGSDVLLIQVEFII